MVEPAVTTRPATLVASGVTEKMAAPILQRTALTYPTGALTVPQLIVPSDVLTAVYGP